ncbi:hypothetical protein BAE44_0008704 [Dichanthelium oligosanthes]|uniref:Uncharacterized protein n=1 Tax=Dichanthelium oligosanthes TaxID=888268 RepID=A0A1E5VYU0_9POAL|nr:hypothetical protein BAE44_0008704 [Dichanthelium oligosanthes]
MALAAMDEALPERCRCLVSDTISSPADWVSDGVTPPDSLVVVCNLSRSERQLCRIRGGAAWVRQSYDMGLCEVPGKAPTERAITLPSTIPLNFLPSSIILIHSFKRFLSSFNKNSNHSLHSIPSYQLPLYFNISFQQICIVMYIYLYVYVYRINTCDHLFSLY